MRSVWIVLALAASVVGVAARARAAEDGCCETVCHTTDGAGRGTARGTTVLATREDCSTTDPHCDVAWRPGACPAGERGLDDRHDGPE